MCRSVGLLYRYCDIRFRLRIALEFLRSFYRYISPRAFVDCIYRLLYLGDDTRHFALCARATAKFWSSRRYEA